MALNIILDLIFILGISFLSVAIVIKIFFDKKSKVCTQIVDASIVDIRKMASCRYIWSCRHDTYFNIGACKSFSLLDIQLYARNKLHLFILEVECVI